METIALEHVPASHTLHMALYKDVANAAHLQSQLLARNPEFEYALIDASIVSLPPFPPLSPASPRALPRSGSLSSRTPLCEDATPA